MLLEADLVCVVGVGLVAVDGLRSVRVLEGGVLLRLVVGGRCCVVHAAELWGRRVARLCTCWAAWVAGHGRRCLEAVQLCGRVHLRGLVVDLSLGAVDVAVGDGS